MGQFCQSCADNDQLFEEANFVPTTATVKPMNTAESTATRIFLQTAVCYI